MSEDIQQHIFDREVTCPICGKTFKTKAVKVNSPRIISKDSDFFIRYSVVNPYFYDVWICNSCGYAAMKSDFLKVKSYEKDAIFKQISIKWKPRKYSPISNPNIAIERYKLALLSATAMEKPSSTLGMILLKISWMYRLINDTQNENIFLKKALDTLSLAYSTERFPMYGLQRDSMSYLLGDLNRRIKNYPEALRWYSSVITTPGVSPRIKELARDGKDLISQVSSTPKIV
ncbi:DUF2225 domain-containing protein [Clostridium sp. HCP1S3_B4]|uniref:DUF2225 domain-containing protein n=1 Tax=unclassified Clostridium TaxID=2614128 RepID=UPI003F8911A4